MQKLDLRRSELAGCAAIAMLAGCGGSAGSGSLPVINGAYKFSHEQTFRYTGSAQFFNVPAGVTKISLIVLGANAGPAYDGAHGGRVYAIIPVTPGERLDVYVGGNGTGIHGGFNGGASGGKAYSYYCACPGYGGGGASDVREGGDRLANRVVVAGGGGGAGAKPNSQFGGGAGGKGGGSVGGSGGTGDLGYGGGGGGGGTQYAGGAGGSSGGGGRGNGKPGAAGSRGNGGSGGAGCYYGSSCYDGESGGGGGGGYYGGGGGGAGGAGSSYEYTGGGGGGGSSYVEPSALKWQSWQGWKDTQHGLIVIHW